MASMFGRKRTRAGGAILAAKADMTAPPALSASCVKQGVAVDEIVSAVAELVDDSQKDHFAKVTPPDRLCDSIVSFPLGGGGDGAH